MSPAQRFVAILVAALFVVGAVVVGISVLGGPGETAATASPTATASASPRASASEAPTAEPSVPTDEEALAILAEIEARVEEIRGLPPADIGPADIGPADLITREQLGEELRRIFDEEYPAEEREQDNIALRAFGLLEPGQDVAELQLDLLGEGVLGFYDDNERRMVIVTDAGLDALAKLTYAHEYTHALQDASFGLDSLEIDTPGENDRGLARTALQEGDANATMIAWAFANLTQAEIIELQEIPLPDTTGIPSWMVAQLDFPYIAGQFWVGQLIGDPLAPDFTAIDAAFADPPTSTEQIIHPEKWNPREEPIPVGLPDLAAALGGGWEEIDSTPVGEASISIVLEYFGVSPLDAGLAAEGWGGDRSLVVAHADGDFALAWRLVWDTPADAGEFLSAYETALGALDFPASVRQLPDGAVLVVHASTQEVHDATLGIAGG